MLEHGALIEATGDRNNGITHVPCREGECERTHIGQLHSHIRDLGFSLLDCALELLFVAESRPECAARDLLNIDHGYTVCIG